MALLRMEGITKIYPGVIANSGITIDIHAGEIHALLGENGAGKSTLMNILFGLTRLDEGQIYWRGQPVEIRHTRDAIELGIGMVHQHFNLVPCFTALENIALQETPSLFRPALNFRALRARVLALCEQFGLKVNLDVPVEDLPLSGQQRVEILKILVANAQLLILDEPTAVLSPPEVEDLFAILRRLIATDRAILLITHKMPEVRDISHRVSVLRGGRLIATHETKDSNEKELVHEMVGRAVSLTVRSHARTTVTSGESALKITDLHVSAQAEREGLHGISLQVNRGEVLGLAGVEGNGQRALFETICGLRAASSGTIEILGNDSTPLTPRQLRDLPMGRIPEDRQTTGLLLDMTIRDNLLLHGYHRPPLTWHGWQRGNEIETLTKHLFGEFDIRAPGLDTEVRRLSGGNQQKIILARELYENPHLLVIANPVRGLDIGATEYVYRLIEAQRERGAAVLLISIDLEEIMTLSDRVAVLYRGRLMGTVKTEESQRLPIGQMMAGIPRHDRLQSETLLA